MANYNGLMATISAAIRANGNEEITGQLLQGVLLTIVNKLGDGYQFGGIATPSGTPTADADARVFYLAFQSGTYTNYGGLVVPAGLTVIAHSDIWQILGTYTMPSDVFVATHGSTTYAEVTAAVNAGKPVFVYYSNRLYELTGRNSELSYVFVCPYMSTLYYLALPTNSAWGSGSSIEMQRVTNMTQAVTTSQSTYPSNKAVKDYVDGHSSSLPILFLYLDDISGFEDPSYGTIEELASIGLTAQAICDIYNNGRPVWYTDDGTYYSFNVTCWTGTSDVPGELTPANVFNEEIEIRLDTMDISHGNVRMIVWSFFSPGNGDGMEISQTLKTIS